MRVFQLLLKLFQSNANQCPVCKISAPLNRHGICESCQKDRQEYMQALYGCMQHRGETVEAGRYVFQSKAEEAAAAVSEARMGR
jgi:predicted amidophosphoribosyltransferase